MGSELLSMLRSCSKTTWMLIVAEWKIGNCSYSAQGSGVIFVTIVLRLGKGIVESPRMEWCST